MPETNMAIPTIIPSVEESRPDFSSPWPELPLWVFVVVSSMLGFMLSSKHTPETSSKNS